jgi:hypothetical protein
MQQAWGRIEKCTRYWWESLKEKDHSEDQGIDWLVGGVDSPSWGYRPVAGSCKHCDELLGSGTMQLVSYKQREVRYSGLFLFHFQAHFTPPAGRTLCKVNTTVTVIIPTSDKNTTITASVIHNSPFETFLQHGLAKSSTPLVLGFHVLYQFHCSFSRLHTSVYLHWWRVTKSERDWQELHFWMKITYHSYERWSCFPKFHVLHYNESFFLDRQWS